MPSSPFATCGHYILARYGENFCCELWIDGGPRLSATLSCVLLEVTVKGNVEDRRFPRFSGTSLLVNLKIPKTSFSFNFSVTKRCEKFRRQAPCGYQFSPFLPSLNKPDKNANCSPHVLSAGLAVMPGESRAFTVICLSFTPPLCTFCIVDVFLFCDFFLGTTNVSYQVKVKCPASDVSCRAPGGESAGVGLPARGHSAALALGLLCAQIQVREQGKAKIKYKSDTGGNKFMFNWCLEITLV